MVFGGRWCFFVGLSWVCFVFSKFFVLFLLEFTFESVIRILKRSSIRMLFIFIISFW